MHLELLAECQRVIGYHFANPKLLEVALTHSSLRTPDRECNERLEFLGDSVLGLVVTEELYRQLPDQAEGELTRLKSAIVSRGSLYRASQRLGLVRFADFARGVGRHEELPVSVTANLVESVIGAIYLDAGFFPAREFVLRHLGEELEAMLEDRGAKNYKSLLQHEVQEAMRLTPTYRTLEEGGPDHRKQFVVAAVIRGQEWGRAGGTTKKEAEQEAARLALEAFQRRGRGRRRQRDEGGLEALRGARDVGEHVDDDELLAPLASEAGAELPPPGLDEDDGQRNGDGDGDLPGAPPPGWTAAAGMASPPGPESAPQPADAAAPGHEPRAHAPRGSEARPAGGRGGAGGSSRGPARGTAEGAAGGAAGRCPDAPPEAASDGAGARCGARAGDVLRAPVPRERAAPAAA
ncbi:MAG: ribonuclease III, partial [Planctomycetia bacterium]